MMIVIRVIYIVLFACTMGSCRELAGGDSGSTTKASSGGGCAEAGFPVKPPPGIPGSLSKKTITPLSFTQKLVRQNIKTLKLGEEFVVVINEKCAAKKGNQYLSRKLVQRKISKNRKLKSRYAFNWKLKKNYSINSFANTVKRDSCIISIDREFMAYPTHTSNDEFYDELSHFGTIKASEAHDIFYNATTGINTEVVVAILDTGVETTHPDLTNQIWVNTGEIPGNSIDDDGNGYIDDVNGYNFVNDIPSVEPQVMSSGSQGHGTHVAGLAAAQAGNAVGVAGVMGYNVKIMGLNIFGTSSGAPVSGTVNAVYYAVDNGADVINLSIGGEGRSDSYLPAFEYAINNGVTILIAAGNDAFQITDTQFYSPAGYGKDLEGALTVGSLDTRTEEKSGFSNYSATYVEIMAPGSDSYFGGVYSTVLNGEYGYKQGTSMAAPVAAGAAALAVALIKSRGGTPTAAMIESYMQSTSDELPVLEQCVEGNYNLNLLNLGQQIDADFP